MAQVVCPQCGKGVDPSDGYCVYCGYTFDDGQPKSPFASAYNQAQAAGDFEETSGGAPVLRFDAGSMPAMPVDNMRRGSGELMFGIGMCRILAIFFAVMVLVSVFLPFVSANVVINKGMLPQTYDASAIVKMAGNKNFVYKEDASNITLSKSASLIGAPSRFLYLMIAACIVGIVFAVKGKPAVYLICGITGSVMAGLNYLLNFSSIEAVTKSSYFTKVVKAAGESGITLNVTMGVGGVLMLIGGVGMIVTAIMFLNNHAAYDD